VIGIILLPVKIVKANSGAAQFPKAIPRKGAKERAQRTQRRRRKDQKGATTFYVFFFAFFALAPLRLCVELLLEIARLRNSPS